MSGIEKEIDNLGRIVLPINYRRQLKLRPGDKMLISLESGVVKMTRTEQNCALCDARLNNEFEVRLCKSCIKKIKALPD